ncbi:fimbrial protein [Atlantibacter sp.]|uniref:fimbrial protein n=1 Tax=Atlantibacter sp. TaxID=1903473 RepID=UPI0028A11F53|nr:fimbrial protein [Atlantibacter sp.]
MKKIIYSLAASTFVLMGAAQADVVVKDATLSVNGVLKETTPSGCVVTLSKTSLNLTGNTSDGSIPDQGQDAKTFEPLKLVVKPQNSLTSGDTCMPQLMNGKIAFKVTGIGDEVEGTVLANTLAGDSAAAGVGVGIYATDGSPIPLNSNVSLLDPKSNSGTAWIGLGLVKLKGKTITEGSIQSSLTVEVAHL